MKHKLLVSLAFAVFAACLAGLPGTALAADEQAEGYRLSMAEALSRALENNLDLVSARTDPRISEENVIASEAGFDFGVSFDPRHSEFKGETVNPSFPNQTTVDSGTIGLSQALKFGAQYDIGLDFTRQERAGTFETVPVSYNSELAVGFSVPLFGGEPGGTTAGRQATTETLIRARGNLEISEETLRTEIHRVMVDVEDAYWNIVADIATLDTRRLALKRSEDLLDLNRKKVKVGTLAPIEITQAEAGVASNEEQVIIAETALENSRDELLRLLGVPPDDPLWNMPLAPTDRPDFIEQQIELDEVIASALANRPEIRSARRQLENDDLSLRVARKQTRPLISVSGRVAPSGNNFETVATMLPPPAPEFTQVTSGTFDEALGEIPDFENYDWNLGVTINYDIGNRAAKSNYSVKKLTRSKSEIAVRNQEQLIRVDARRSVRAVDSGIKRVQAARKNVELQEKKLDAEQKKFENGMSTSFEVLTFQSDLADSQLAMIQAGLDYVRALTALERSKGTLLESRGLALAEKQE